MKKLLLPILIATLGLTGCYLPQNFDNQVQVSRTGQYQVDVDTDVISGYLLMAQQESVKRKQPIPAKDLQKVVANCEKEFNEIVAKDAQKNKNIISSKYLGECKGHLTLKYTGNIIQEKSFNATTKSSDDKGFYIPVEMKYDAKTKQITVKSDTKADKSAKDMYGDFVYNGKLSVKTDGKVISSNADSKPYWGLIGSYKWDIKDFNTPNGKIVISTTGI